MLSSPPSTPQPSSTMPLIQYYLSLLDRSFAAKDLSLGRLLHARLLKSGLAAHTLLSNRLIHLYSHLNLLPSALRAFSDLPFKNFHSYNTLLSALPLPHALRLFHRMPRRNLVSYNTLISSLARRGFYQDALRLFARLPGPFDRFTAVAAAAACAGLRDLKSLKRLHGSVVSMGIRTSLIVDNVLVDGYGKCGDVELAKRVFDGMGERDVVSWTSLLGAYARGGRLHEAKSLFGLMPVRNEVSWTAMVSGYEQNGEEERAVEVFEEMLEEGIAPMPATLVSVLSACARLGFVGRGKQVHGYIVRRSCFNIIVYNALVDMYSKCGVMGSASEVFDSMPERSVISWNSMVTGLAHNGLGTQALEVFERMVEAGVAPTNVTFLGVLSACSHAGLVSEGRRFLNLMEEKYGVSPSNEHYAAFIDALGRRRMLKEAAELIESLPSSNAGMWGALLGACKVHGDLELGKRAAESLFALEPEKGARYVTLSNIYAAVGKWEEAKRVRVEMKRKGLKKESGSSWIEVRSVKHVFGAGEETHCQIGEIYGMVHELADQIIEEKTDYFPIHGEKLCNLSIGS